MAGWNDAGKDAVMGAGMGAAFGPYGAAIGGVAGGLYGYFSGPTAEDQANAAMQNGAGYNYIGSSPYKGSWDALINQLRQQASGAGPSLAVMQYQKANQQAMSNQLAMARSQGSPGAAYQASNNMGRIDEGMAQGSAQMRLQEQMAAQAQLANALGTVSGQDLQRQQANQQAYLQILAEQLKQPSTFDQMAGITAKGLGAYAMMHQGGSNNGGYQPFGAGVGGMSDDSLTAAPATPAAAQSGGGGYSPFGNFNQPGGYFG